MDSWISFIVTERKIFVYLLRRCTTAYKKPITSEGTDRFASEIGKKPRVP